MQLKGKVALVAGATRGAGRGIAVALGEMGATVVCTGRSSGGHASPLARPETLEETAALVDAAGGRGIAMRCDHAEPSQVEILAKTMRNEYGGLDVVVDDLWGGDPLVAWGKPFWESDLGGARDLLRSAVWGHLVTGRHLAPLLRDEGLWVEVTDGDSFQFRGNTLYDLCKMFAIRFAFDLQEEMGRRATAVAVTPGFLRSEAMLDHFGVTEATWKDAILKDRHFAESETPRFVGRAVSHLAADSTRGRFAGRVLSSWGLSDEYPFTDLDGRRPHWGRFFAGLYPGLVLPATGASYAEWLGNRRLMEAIGAGAAP